MNKEYRNYVSHCKVKKRVPKSFTEWQENYVPRLRKGAESKEHHSYVVYKINMQKIGKTPKSFLEWQEMRKHKEELMSFDEIAKVLGLSLDSVKYAYRKAMIKLKNNHRLKEVNIDNSL